MCVGIFELVRGWCDRVGLVGRGGWEGGGVLFASLEHGGGICELRGSLELGWRGGGSGSSVVQSGFGRKRA